MYHSQIVSLFFCLWRYTAKCNGCFTRLTTDKMFVFLSACGVVQLNLMVIFQG